MADGNVMAAGNAVLQMVIQVKRAATGKVEDYVLTGIVGAPIGDLPVLTDVAEEPKKGE